MYARGDLVKGKMFPLQPYSRFARGTVMIVTTLYGGIRIAMLRYRETTDSKYEENTEQEMLKTSNYFYFV